MVRVRVAITWVADWGLGPEEGWGVGWSVGLWQVLTGVGLYWIPTYRHFRSRRHLMLNNLLDRQLHTRIRSCSTLLVSTLSVWRQFTPFDRVVTVGAISIEVRHVSGVDTFTCCAMPVAHDCTTEVLALNASCTRMVIARSRIKSLWLADLEILTGLSYFLDITMTVHNTTFRHTWLLRCKDRFSSFLSSSIHSWFRQLLRYQPNVLLLWMSILWWQLVWWSSCVLQHAQFRH